MKILIYGLNYFPELIGVGKYSGEMAEWLAKRGHEVSVITSPPYYPYWKVQPPYSSWRYQKENLNGVKVYRCPLWVPRTPTGKKRLIHHALFTLTSFPVLIFLLFKKPDAVITIAPSFLNAVLTAFLSKINRFKSWLHIYDFELDTAHSLKMISNEGIINFAKKIEKWTLQKFDRVSVLSMKMVERLKRKGIQGDKTYLFRLWVDTQTIQPLEPSQTLRAEWNIPPGKKVVMYSGNMGRKQGLELLIPAASHFLKKNPDILFILVGDGPMKPWLKKEAAEKKLGNVIFKPLQPMEKHAALLATADLHLVLQLKAAADLVLPSKCLSIFSAGKASIITAEPDTRLYQLARERKLGWVVEPESPAALIAGIENLLSDDELRLTIEKNARAMACDEIDREKILGQFEENLFTVVSSSPIS